MVLLIGGGFIGWKIWDGNRVVEKNQALIEPFYEPPASIPAKPGTIIRSQPMDDVAVPGGKAYRILYASTGFKGEPVAVSGMIFVPEGTAPAGGRKVLAWAHGTVGLADKCAPSRSQMPLSDMDVWLGEAMQRGWVVSATDYLGLGTPGPTTYLIGSQEAADVVNSVRAAKDFPAANASDDWIVVGHSQGGHSALWTGQLAAKIAPELKLKGVIANAPATELAPIMNAQWNTPVGWVIGAEAALAFGDYYGGDAFLNSLSKAGRDQLTSLQGNCTLQDGLTALAFEKFGVQFFSSNPVDNPAWAKAAFEQTPKPLPANMPLFMSEGTDDSVVLSASNALMQQKWCAAGSDMTALWLGGAQHLQVAILSGHYFINWATSVFSGSGPTRNCEIPPATPPMAPLVPKV